MLCNIVLVIGLAFSPGSGDRLHSAESLPQADTIASLQQYLQTADWKLRKEVERATGDREILASRIFRAFSDYIVKGLPFEEEEAARIELERNPRLTLIFLKPILREEMTEAEEQEFGGKTHPPVSPLHSDMYIELCSRFASVEHDGFAMRILSETSEHENAHIKQQAVRMAEFVREECNYRAKSDLYKQTKDVRALEWLVRDYLPTRVQKGLTKSDVEDLLGPADYKESAVWVGRHPSECDTQKVKYLWLSFFDSRLSDWRWGDRPNTPAPDV